MKDSLSNLLDALLPAFSPYVVFESANPPRECLLAESLGVTGPLLDVTLMPWLQSRGEWNGRAPAIFVADDRVATVAAEAKASAEQIVAAVVIHEAAHIVDRGIDLSPPTPERCELAAEVAAYSTRTADDPARPPMDGHGWRFVRLAVHLHHRAEATGWHLPINYLFSGRSYEIADPSLFQYALQQEPKNLADVPILEINTFRPPAQFVALWQTCMWAWINGHRLHPGIPAAIAMLPCEPQV
jgi:hypothetical protein